jgi:phosphoglycolate phosphatase
VIPTDADAVLFDLDGCLIDSRVAFSRSLNAALAAHGFARRPAQELVGYLGPPLQGTLRELVGDGDGVIEELARTYRARYGAHAAQETEVFPGIHELLAHLSARVPLVIATTKAQVLADPLVQALGLREPFLAVVGTPAPVAEEPKDRTVARALRALPQGTARAVMVGDRRFDVQAARANGVRSVGVLWGIGSEAELREAGADALAAAPSDLLGLAG